MTQQDFSRRSTATELMDTDPVSFKEFDDYLRDLERINVLTLAYRPTMLWLKRALADFPAGRPISVLDVGSGGGMPGIPLAIARPDLPVTLLDSNSKKSA